MVFVCVIGDQQKDRLALKLAADMAEGMGVRIIVMTEQSELLPSQVAALRGRRYTAAGPVPGSEENLEDIVRRVLAHFYISSFDDKEGAFAQIDNHGMAVVRDNFPDLG